MVLFDLDDITSEKIALATADDLVKEGIEAANAQRGKRMKIRTAMAKIKMLNSWCGVNKWREPIKRLKKSFNTLETCMAELDVNLWGI